MCLPFHFTYFISFSLLYTIKTSDLRPILKKLTFRDFRTFLDKNQFYNQLFKFLIYNRFTTVTYLYRELNNQKQKEGNKLVPGLNEAGWQLKSKEGRLQNSCYRLFQEQTMMDDFVERKFC